MKAQGRVSGSTFSHFLLLFGRGGTLFQLRDTGGKDKLEDLRFGCDEFGVLLRTMKEMWIGLDS